MVPVTGGAVRRSEWLRPWCQVMTSSQRLVFHTCGRVAHRPSVYVEMFPLKTWMQRVVFKVHACVAVF